MNTTNKILAVLVVVQLILVGLIYLPGDEEPTAPGGALLSEFSAETVSEIQISDDQDNAVTLRKNSAGDWVLPDYGDYPAESLKIDTLLDKLAGLQRNRLITESDTSHRRLKVNEDEYLRRITVGDTVLFLGTSGGGNATHARIADDDNVYLVGDLATTDASATVSSWINTTYFNQTPGQIVGVTLENANGTFAFSKEGDTWTMADLAEGETLNVGGFENFLNQASVVRITEPLGKDADEAYGMDNPQATLTLRVAETPDALSAEATAEATAEPEPVITEYTVVIGAELENGVVVKSSASEFYVLMSATSAASLTDKTRENFVLAPTPEPTPEATAEPTLEATTEATMEPVATLEATAAPTEEALEATAVPTEEN